MSGQEKISPLAVGVEDAYRSLGVGRTLFYELVGRRELTTIKIGHRTMVPCSELQRFISERLNANDRLAPK